MTTTAHRSAKIAALLVAIIAIAAGLAWVAMRATPRPAPLARVAATPPLDARTYQSPHYTIATRATDAQTRRVADAAEALRTAYIATFPEVAAKTPAGKHRLVLYRDRADFKAHNRSRPWAEAFYLAPACHAYFSEGDSNPTHWMVHEATHQLNRELAGIPHAKWVDEGLATYFGTSRLEHGVLRVGVVDPETYPAWWLNDLAPGDDHAHEIRAGRLVPLHAVITGKGGPDLDTNFNSWYIAYWSLTHFLFHHDGGRHAAGWRKVIVEGGTLESFERNIGPVDAIEPQWIEYLKALKDSGVDRSDEVILVD